MSTKRKLPPKPNKSAVVITKTGKSPDPWCLVCGVNLKLDGRSYVRLTADSASDSRKVFAKVLGVKFGSDHPSQNMCGKCDRALKRIHKYPKLDSAKKECDEMKKSLEENIKKGKKAAIEKTSTDGDVSNHVQNPNQPSNIDSRQTDPLIEKGEEEEEAVSAADTKDEDRELRRELSKELDQLNKELDKEEANSTQKIVNEDPNKMPFGFIKKSKKDKKEKKDKEKKEKQLVSDQDTKPEGEQQAEHQNGVVQQLQKDGDYETQPRDFKEGTTLAEMAKHVPKKPAPPQDYEDASDGGYTPARTFKVVGTEGHEETSNEKPLDRDETEVKTFEVKDGPTKSENSPLITNEKEKESKLKDQQPGMLCCCIL